MAQGGRPAYFSEETFRAKDFDPEEFIRRFQGSVGLEAMRADLVRYNAQVHKTLVDGLTRDFGKYIALRPHLDELEGGLSNLQGHVDAATAVVQGTYNDLSMVVDDLERQLDRQRALLLEKRAAERALDVAEMLERLERLLWGARPEPASHSQATGEKGASGTPAKDASPSKKVLNELVAEYMAEGTAREREIRFFERAGPVLCSTRAEVARMKGELVEQMSWKVNTLHAAYLERLDSFLSALLPIEGRRAGVSGSGGSDGTDAVPDAEMIRADVDLALRSYAGAGATGACESLLRQVWVQPFAEQCASVGNLKALGLEGLFQELLSFTESVCGFLDHRRAVAVATDGGPTVAPLSDTLGFKFIPHTLFAAFEPPLLANCTSIFLSGIPSVFRSNYLLGMAFLRHMEALCVSAEELKALRASASYKRFVERWNIEVYFQLHAGRVLGVVEPLIASSAKPPTDGPAADFACVWTAEVFAAISSLFSSDVFIPDLLIRFLALTNEILGAAGAWLDAGLKLTSSSSSPPPPPAAAAAAASASSASVSAGWTELGVESLVRIYSDLSTLAERLFGLVARLPGLFVETQLVSKMNPEIERVAREFLEDACEMHLFVLRPVLSSRISALVGRTCAAALAPVRGVPATYRMTSKPPPTRASYYVPQVLLPLRELLETYCSGGVSPTSVRRQMINCDSAARADWAGRVVEHAAKRFAELASDVATTVRRTESSLQRLQSSSNIQLPAAARQAAGQEERRPMSDSAKIFLQLRLDVDEFWRIVNEEFKVDTSVEPLSSVFAQLDQATRDPGTRSPSPT